MQAGFFTVEYGLTLDEVEELYVRQILDRVDDNKTKAAKILGISRKTLYDRLRRWDERKQNSSGP